MKYHILFLVFLASFITGCATTQNEKVVNQDVISDQIVEVFNKLPEHNEINRDIKAGMKALKMSDTKQAHKAFESGLRIDPTNGQLHFLNSLTYHVEALSGNSKMLDFAEAGYQTTLRFDPSNYWAAYFLGHIYFDDGRYTDAQNQFSYGLLYSPDNPYFLRALAVSAYYTKDIKLNNWAAKKAYNADPNNLTTLRTLMFSEAASGNLESAKKQLKSYKKLAKNDQNEYINKLTSSSLSRRLDDWKYFYASANAGLLPLDGINDNNYQGGYTDKSDIPTSTTSNVSYIQKDGFDYVIYIMMLSTHASAQQVVDKLDYKYLEIVEESEKKFSVRRRVKQEENASEVLSQIREKFKDAWMRPILPIKVITAPKTKIPLLATDNNAKKEKTIKKKVPKLPKMVLVDVVILRTEEIYSENKGINLLDGLTATLTGTLLAYTNVKGTAADGSSMNTEFTTISPSLTLTGLEYNLNIFNEGANKIEILARPSLLAVENQPSKFHSGSVMHVQLSSTYSDGSMVDVPIGIDLNITPKFHGDDTLEIVVHAERSYLEPRSENVGFQAFSQTSRTSVDATAILKYNETLILSGLTVSESEMTKSGVPGLQDIPGVQYLFSNEQKANLKKSILILLTPRKAKYFQNDIDPKEAEKALKIEKETHYAHTNSLKNREKIDNNIDAVLAHMANKKLYRQFRKGDLELDEWYKQDTMTGAFDRVLGFLYY